MSELAPLAERFMRLFAGYDRAYGSYEIPKNAIADEKGKVQGRGATIKKPVTAKLWEKHLAGETGLGIIPHMADGNVSWASIDIDIYPLDLDALEKQVIALSLPLVMMRTKSGGAHLTLFMAELVPAKYARGKLAEWAILLGYPGVEIFPKQNDRNASTDVGNWINMPYYDADRTERYGILKGRALTASEFLDYAEGCRIPKEALDKFIVGGDELFLEGPPCLQHLTKSGFPKGTRNRGLFSLGVFTRFAFGDDWRAKLDEFNQRYMNPPLPSAEVMDIQKSLGRKEYFYTCNQDPIASHCNKEICRTRKYGIGNTDNTNPPILIGQITKIDSDPPVYVVEVDGHEITCTSDDILSQLRFSKLVFERANRMIPMLKQSVWASMVNEKMANLVLQEAPKDSGPEGQFFSHIEQFCTGRVTANNLDEIILGKPYVNQTDGRTYFRSPDLIKYLDQQRFRDFNERKVWATLRSRDGKHHQFMLKGKCVAAWSIPSFNQQIEGFETPAIEGDDL